MFTTPYYSIFQWLVKMAGYFKVAFLINSSLLSVQEMLKFNFPLIYFIGISDWYFLYQMHYVFVCISSPIQYIFSIACNISIL